MSEQELETQLKRIEALCAETAQIMATGREAGRMPSLPEAKRLDALSVELLDAIHAVQAFQAGEQEQIISESLRSAREAIEIALQKRSGDLSKTASAQQISAYQRY